MKYKQEFGQAEAYVRAGFSADARDYRPAAEILIELGVRSVVLLTSNPEKSSELERRSMIVSETRNIFE